MTTEAPKIKNEEPDKKILVHFLSETPNFLFYFVNVVCCCRCCCFLSFLREKKMKKKEKEKEKIINVL